MSLAVRYHPCAEQRALADTFNDALRTLLPLDRLHASHEECDEVWSKLEDVGLFTIGLEEHAGGSGLGAAEEALIVIELGRRLVSPAVLARIGIAHAKFAAPDTRPGPGWRMAAAYRHAGRVVVVGSGRTHGIVLRDGDTAEVRPAPQALAPIDDVLWHADLHAAVEPQGTLAAFDAAGVNRLRLIDAAALAGIAAAALDAAVGYAGERRQFGRPIGSFQAVKHHCADMAIAARYARDQVGFASVAVDQHRQDAALQVDCALWVAGAAALRNTAKNIQIHGGIGFSEEAMPHLLLKRTQLLVAIAGGLEAANARIADSVIGKCRA